MTKKVKFSNDISIIEIPLIGDGVNKDYYKNRSSHTNKIIREKYLSMIIKNNNYILNLNLKYNFEEIKSKYDIIYEEDLLLLINNQKIINYYNNEYTNINIDKPLSKPLFEKKEEIILNTYFNVFNI